MNNWESGEAVYKLESGVASKTKAWLHGLAGALNAKPTSKIQAPLGDSTHPYRKIFNKPPFPGVSPSFSRFQCQAFCGHVLLRSIKYIEFRLFDA
jgi:hypothetical protein